jgi:hypothetical protein
MNALLYFLEAHGFEVEVETCRYGYFYSSAEIFGEKVRFSLEWEYRRLKLEVIPCPRSMQSSWRDGKRHSVECYFVCFATTLAYTAGLQASKQ